tara:strand:+ start:156 stop:446 length:291 start_codon:yes stop_codon:yes gene_type:complete
MEFIIAHLTIAQTGRAYYSVNNWTESKLKCADGSSLMLLSNKSNVDTRKLSEDAITSALLPDEFSHFDSVEELINQHPHLPKAIKLNTITGEATPV